ncbi:MAG: hypothetical protein CMJ83_13805 [Planctomycetes bacterium]|nr:hypothetical protein [Planctomycetota bacterium]
MGTVKIEDETLIKPIRGTHEARGVYQLDGLQPGSVRLFIEHDGRELRRRVASSAGEGAIRLSDLR